MVLQSLKRGLLVGLLLAAWTAMADSSDRGRAAWMQGRYGIMVHWLYPREGDIDRWTDNFDLPGFLDDFRRTGADWLIFTAGQGRGAYASPNAVFDRYCGEGHTSRRDLLLELARGVKAQGKRFIVYSAVDFVNDGCTNHAMQVGLGWKTNSVDRHLFERRWPEVLSVWSRRLGRLCDGWWLDGCSNNLYPAGVDWPRWLTAVRAGNPDSAVAFNAGLYQFAEPWGPSDYTAGETMSLAEAEKVVYWLKDIPGHQRHYLFPIDGYWGAYWVWPQGEWTRAEVLQREHPELFRQSYFDALQARGEFAPPIYSRKRLRDFLLTARNAGAGVTVNVGIAPSGRLNPAAVKLLGGLDLDGMEPRTPPAISAPDAAHARATRHMEGIPAIAVTPKGTMWCTWYASRTTQEDESNYLVLSVSRDAGRTWNETRILDPDGDGPRRAFDPQLWIDPAGRLHWFWSDRVGKATDPAFDDQLWRAVLDAETGEVCEPPHVVARGIMTGKPIVSRDGTWYLPVANWFQRPSSTLWASTDGGRTFACRGGVTLPKDQRAFDEHNVLERTNGELVVYMRTTGAFVTNALWTAVSADGGRTWCEARPDPLVSVSSRSSVIRLRNGHWLAIKHGRVGEWTDRRRRLCAVVSEDEGRTWKGGLLLDERHSVSYPDAQQLADGSIAVVSDFDRRQAREISFVRFTEADVLRGSPIPPRQLVSKAHSHQ